MSANRPKVKQQKKSVAAEAEQVKSQLNLNESLADLVKKIRKEHGPEAVQTADRVQPVKRLPTGLVKLDKIIRGGWPMGRVVEVWGPQCVAPDTLVLRADLAWVRADSLKSGDALVTLDEYPLNGRGSKRKMRIGVVTNASVRTANRVRVRTSAGDLVVSDEHPFLWKGAARRKGNNSIPAGKDWKQAGRLESGDTVAFWCAPWSTDNSAAWLAGMYDGEGSVSRGRIGIAQREGFLWNEIVEEHKRRGFMFNHKPKGLSSAGNVIMHGVTDNVLKAMEVVGTIRPRRLNQTKLWDGWKAPSGNAVVYAIKKLGQGDVVTLTTTTGTLVTNGFPTHNSAGKSTLMFRSIAAIQKADPKSRIAYFDLENTFDTEWAVKCGITLNRLLHVKAVTAERAGDLLLRLVRDNWTMVIVDSLVELIPKDVLEKETGKATYAPVANVLSALLPKVVVLQSNSPTVVVMVNQVRDLIGWFLGKGKKSPGGNALYHIDSLKLRVQRKEPIWGSLLSPGWAKHLEQIGIMKPKPKKEYGYVMAIKVVKSKVSREGEMCLLPVLFDIGIVEEAVRDEATTGVSAAGPAAGGSGAVGGKPTAQSGGAAGSAK